MIRLHCMVRQISTHTWIGTVAAHGELTHGDGVTVAVLRTRTAVRSANTWIVVGVNHRSTSMTAWLRLDRDVS